MVIIVTIKVILRILPLAQLPAALVPAVRIAWVLSACLTGIVQNVDLLTQQAQVLSGHVPLTMRPQLIHPIRPAVIPTLRLRAVHLANGGTIPETLVYPALQPILHTRLVHPVSGGTVQPVLEKQLQLRIAPRVITGMAILA